MVPALFGVSVSQINLLFDTLIATMLVSGSVSWLYYSDRLMELPLGTFGIAIAIVVLPSLSRKHATSSGDEFAETLDWAFSPSSVDSYSLGTGTYCDCGAAADCFVSQ